MRSGEGEEEESEEGDAEAAAAAAGGEPLGEKAKKEQNGKTEAAGGRANMKWASPPLQQAAASRLGKK